MATRYLLNDACVLSKKVLVSGSALRMEGQVTVYNYEGGPCYRCLFPKPPSPETVTNCSEGGVIGVVTGIIGCMQVLEVIKIATKTGTTLSQKLLLFDAMYPRYQIVKLRPRNISCEVCGDHPSITHLIDYVEFCKSGPHDKTPSKNLLKKEDNISCKEFKTFLDQKVPYILLDVRHQLQYDICSLPNSLHIPLACLEQKIDQIKEKSKSCSGEDIPVFCICRRGNDSQEAVQILQSAGFKNVKNIEGGLTQWGNQVDPSFPIY